MQILLLTDGIWPYVLGGMQKHSYYLCKYLARQGVEVHLLHYNDSAYQIEKLEFFTEEEKRFIHPIVVDFPTAPAFPGHYLYRSWLYSRRAYVAVKHLFPKTDFIYSKGFTAWYLLGQKEKHPDQFPPVGVKFHGYEMFQKTPDFKTSLQMRLLLRWPVRWISRKADLVFSYGGKITGLIRALGVEGPKIVELPSGIESSGLAAEATSINKLLRFVFLGRYERRKGVEELNAVLPELLSEGNHPAFEMHFIGPIPEDKKIRNENVIYHGEIRDKQVLQTKLRSCDVLICPSWSEGFPNVLLEAMGNGLTVLATDVGAVRVLVNTENGFLIDNPKAENLKRAILTLLSCSESQIQKKKQSALHTIAQNFTWEILIKRLVDFLRDRTGNKKM